MADRQCRQITTKQLLACGVSEQQIRTRVERRNLHPGPRGVYSVGTPARTDEELAMAAVLAVRDGVLGERSAGNLLGLHRWPRRQEVVFVPRNARPRDDVDVRRRRLDPADVTTWHGIPVTTVPRTLLDLAAVLPADALRKALVRARVDHFLTDDQLRDVLARHPRHPGTERLSDAFTGPTPHTELESAFLTLLTSQRDLPLPRTQARIGAARPDFVWEKERVIVEIDGPHHAFQWQEDAIRKAKLEAEGWTVLRFTEWDITRDTARTLARIRAALTNTA